MPTPAIARVAVSRRTSALIAVVLVTATHGLEAQVTLRFRPRYYQRHRGLTQYRPWTYQPWSESVAGWTSWYAFTDRVTEAERGLAPALWTNVAFHDAAAAAAHPAWFVPGPDGGPAWGRWVGYVMDGWHAGA